MSKGRRSGSRKPSDKVSQSAFKDISPSPSSALDAVSPSDQQVNLDTETMETVGELPRNAEQTTKDLKAQDQAPIQASEVPVPADDGFLNSPQIEPTLGIVVEDLVGGAPDEEPQTPASTHRSLLGEPEGAGETSPAQWRPSPTLDVELENESMDGSEEDIPTEFRGQDITREGSSGSDPEQQNPAGNPEASGSNDVPSGRTEEEFQQERRRRLAAEEKAQKLEAELKEQQQRHEEEADVAKRKYERALQKANQAMENDKMKFKEESDENSQKTDKAYQDEIDRIMENMARVTKDLETANKVATAEAEARSQKEAEQQRELRRAYEKSVHPQMEMSPFGAPPTRAPPMTPGSDSKPGSARFLLAEFGYLLNKSGLLHEALRAAADFADGRAGKPSEKDQDIFNEFSITLHENNEFMVNHMDRAQDCLLEVRRDWGVAAEQSHW